MILWSNQKWERVNKLIIKIYLKLKLINLIYKKMNKLISKCLQAVIILNKNHQDVIKKIKIKNNKMLIKWFKH